MMYFDDLARSQSLCVTELVSASFQDVEDSIDVGRGSGDELVLGVRMPARDCLSFHFLVARSGNCERRAPLHPRIERLLLSSCHLVTFVVLLQLLNVVYEWKSKWITGAMLP